MISLSNYLKEPWRIICSLQNHGLGYLISDKIYIKAKFREQMGYRLNLNNPRTFNEKLQWLKLYDRNPCFTKLVDKYEVKNSVADIIGDKFIIPTIGVWNTFDEIDFTKLPNQFVLKCTHDSGGLVICRDKNNFDRQKAKERIEKSLSTNYYLCGREVPYKNVQPKVIAESFIADSNGELKDYKFFCFNGEVCCFKIDFNRFIRHQANYYSRNGKLLHFGEVEFPPDYNVSLEIPLNIEQMIQVSEKLSKDIPFVRVDLYNVDGRIFFGEMTFFPAAGFGKFTSTEWDYKLGKWIVLPNTKKN